MQAFPCIADQVRADMFLHGHFRYFLREARVTAYAQARCHFCLDSVCSLHSWNTFRPSFWNRTRR